MSKGAKELYDALKRINSPGASVLPGVVKSVNSDDTVDVDVAGVTFFDVLCQSSVNGGQKGIKIKPAVDSVVLIERIGDQKSDEYVVIMYSEIDESSTEIDTVKMLMDADGFILQKGNDTLLNIIVMIIDAVSKTVVLQGTNPDHAALIQAKTKVQNLFKQ